MIAPPYMAIKCITFVELTAFIPPASVYTMKQAPRMITESTNEHKTMWRDIMDQIAEKYGENFADFPEFKEVKERIYKLYDLAKTDGIKKCLTHGDCRDENFLINDHEIHLIDWEYAGYGDPGFDIGSYVCGGGHSEEEVDRILFTYFGKKPSIKEQRHFYAYIAITGFFYMHWTMYKESQGQIIGYLKPQWYHFAKEYSKKALPLYNE